VKEFSYGTEMLLRAMASSFATTIVSGGHLSAALQKFGIKEWIDHVSTAGGALVLYLAGKKLPLIEALYRAAKRWRSKK
jgi:phosphoglycerate kinase